MGFRARLKKAKEEGTFLKIIFQYPASNRAIVKRGYVISVNEDSFDFEEKIDGLVTYSYDYIVEIKEEVEENEHLS